MVQRRRICEEVHIIALFGGNQREHFFVYAHKYICLLLIGHAAASEYMLTYHHKCFLAYRLSVVGKSLEKHSQHCGFSLFIAGLRLFASVSVGGILLYDFSQSIKGNRAYLVIGGFDKTSKGCHKFVQFPRRKQQHQTSKVVGYIF